MGTTGGMPANWRIGLDEINQGGGKSVGKTAKRRNGALNPCKSTKVVSPPLGETAKPLLEDAGETQKT